MLDRNEITVSGVVASDPVVVGTRSPKFSVYTYLLVESSSLGPDPKLDYEKLNRFSTRIFGETAATEAGELKPGDQIVITGRLDQANREIEGEPINTVEIIASEITPSTRATEKREASK